MIRTWFPWIGGAALSGGAVFFAEPLRTFVLVGIMLFFPLVDRAWRIPDVPRAPKNYVCWLILLLITGTLLAVHRQYLDFALATLLTAALPEEWFFRAYFQTTLGAHPGFRGLRSVVVASLLFSLIHGLSRDWTTALLVFGPSVFYGWLYQRTRDFVLIVLTHAASNVLYVAYLSQMIGPMQGLAISPSG